MTVARHVAFSDAAIALAARLEVQPTAAFQAVRALGLTDVLEDFLRAYQELDAEDVG